MSSDRTDAVLAAIDGALADDEFPDAMRWSPEPEQVTDAPAPYDGELVWQPYERGAGAPRNAVHDYDPALPIGPRNFPRVSTRRGGIRFRWDAFSQAIADGEHHDVDRTPAETIRGMVADVVIVDDPIDWPLRGATLTDLVNRMVADHLSPLAPTPEERAATVERAAAARCPRAPVDAPLGYAGHSCEIRPVFPAQERLQPLPRPFLFAAMEEELADHWPTPPPLDINWMVEVGQAWAQVADRMHTVFRDVGKAWLNARGALQDAGVLEADPPTDPRERALQARRHRGTGPDRQLQHQRRPRHHGPGGSR